MRSEVNTSSKKIQTFAKKNNIPKTSSKIIFEKRLAKYKEIQNIDSSLTGDFFPASGIMFYNEDNILTSIISPQKVDGGFRFDWNRHHSFDSFPPENTSDSLCKIDYKNPLRMKTYLTSTLTSFNSDSTKSERLIYPQENTMFVFWSYGLYAHSKKLLKLIENYKMKNKSNFQIIYVNMDESYCRSETSIQFFSK